MDLLRRLSEGRTVFDNNTACYATWGKNETVGCLCYLGMSIASWYFRADKSSFPICGNYRKWITNEPPHDKTNKIACAPSEDSDQPVWASAQFDQSSWRKLGSLATHWAQVKTLIRLGRCPGWSESLLGARHFVGFVMMRLISKIWRLLFYCLRISQTDASRIEPLHKKTCF